MIEIIKYYITAKEPLLVMLVLLCLGVLSMHLFDNYGWINTVTLSAIFTYLYIFEDSFFGRKSNLVDNALPISENKIWMAKMISIFLYLNVLAFTLILIELLTDSIYEIRFFNFVYKIYSAYLLSIIIKTLSNIKSKNTIEFIAAAFGICVSLLIYVLSFNISIELIDNAYINADNALVKFLYVSPIIVTVIIDYLLSKLSNWNTLR